MKKPVWPWNTSANVRYLYYFRINLCQDPDRTVNTQSGNSLATKNNLIKIKPEQDQRRVRQHVVKEPEILKRPGERRLLRPVWVATLSFEIKVEVEIEVERKLTTDQI